MEQHTSLFGQWRGRLNSFANRPAWQHALCIISLFLISLWYFHPLLSTTQTLNNIHYLDNLAFLSHSIAQATSQYGEFPLWNPHTFGGIPLMGVPEHAMFDLNIFLVLLTKQVYLSMNIAAILYFFIAGLGMYLLVFSVVRSKRASFLSALLFMFNGFMHSFIKSGHINLLESYSLIPFVILFAHLSITKGKETLFLYAFLSGVFLSLQIFAGGIIFFLYTLALLGILFMLHSLTSFSLQTIKRLLLCGILIGIIAFGVSAVKLLPTLEFTSQSNRAGGVGIQEYLGNPVDMGSWLGLFVYNHGFQSTNSAMGIFGALLMIFGLLSFKKRYVMFSAVVILFSILLASGSFAAQFFYEFVPGFGKMRHIERALVLFAFAAPLLCGFGAKNLFSLIEQRSKRHVSLLVFGIAILLISADLILFQPFPQTIEVTNPDDIGILTAISSDSDTFRVINLGLKEFIGSSGYVYYMQNEIGDVKGGGGIWPHDYPEFLYFAQQSNPSKLLGLLNVKYIISDTNTSIPSTQFMGSFNACPACIIPIAFGPNLYKNNDFIPRAYTTPIGILVVGNQKAVKDIIYFLLLSSKQPTAFINGAETLNAYSANDLKKYSAIVLATGSIDQQSLNTLRSYADSGGRIFPDILNNENSLGDEAIARLLDLTTEKPSTLTITRSSFNSLEVDTRNASGFAILSERFAFYPGWKAHADGEELSIQKAGNTLTGIYLDKPYRSITFTYKPASFLKGALITALTLFFSLGYLAFAHIKRRKHGQESSIHTAP